MRRVIPLLSLLLLLCACGTGPSASAPEDSRLLVIFTARSAAVYDDAVREFERRTGIWVEVRTADGTLPLLEQIAAGDSGCDLLLGAAPDSLSAHGDCFAPYAAPLAADIPDAWRDSEDRWTPFALLPTVLIYNDQLVQRNVPDSWADLTGVAWRGRIACPDPTVSATGCTALQALQAALPAEKKQELAGYLSAMEAVQPTELTAAEIGVRIGASWVPTDVYQQFMFELFGTSVYARQRMRVVRSEYSGEWNISNKSMDGGNIKAVTTYGTKRITAYHILEQTLNQRVVKVFDTVVEDGKERPVLNVKETAIAQDRQELIKSKFAD